MSDGKKKRRIVDLDVEEVSLVDRPAIRRKFVIIKRLEDEMGAFEMDPEVVEKNDTGTVMDWLQKAAKGDDAPKEAIAKVIELLDAVEKAEPEKKPEEEDKEKVLPADLKEAITAVSAWMKKMSKGPGAPTEAIGRVATFLGKVAGGKYPSPESAGKVEPKEEEDKNKSPTAKVEDDNLVVVKADGTMVINAAVTKGRKVFTTERTNAMKEVMIQLASVLGEADGEALKAVLTAIKALPEGKVPDSAVRPVPTAKSESDGVVVKALEDIQKRLDDIEKTRAPSKGGDPEVSDEPVEKKEAGFWGGNFLNSR